MAASLAGSGQGNQEKLCAALRTSHLLHFPIHDEAFFVKPFARLRLPARIVSDRPQDRDSILALTAHQPLCIRVASIDQVHFRMFCPGYYGDPNWRVEASTFLRTHVAGDNRMKGECILTDKRLTHGRPFHTYGQRGEGPFSLLCALVTFCVPAEQRGPGV